jgi:hypothetical protein
MTFFTHCALRSYLFIGRVSGTLKQELNKASGITQAELFFVSFIFSLKILAL